MFDISQALRLHQGRQLLAAQAAYRRILAEDPAQGDALHLLGALSAEMGRAQMGMTLIKRAVAARWRADYYINLCTIFRVHGGAGDARAIHRVDVALRPDHLESYFSLAEALRAGDPVETAEAAWRHALALKPDQPETRFNLGRVLRHQGHLEAAETAFRKALSLKPDFPEAHCGLGSVLHTKTRLKPAEVACRRAIALKPDYSKAHLNLAVILYDGDQSLGEAVCRKALALKPDYLDAQHQMGVVLQARGRLDVAETAYRRAIALKPDHQPAYSNLGGVLQTKSPLEAAELVCRKALALKPDSLHAHHQLGLALQTRGRLDATIAAYARARAVDPADPCTRWNEALARLTAGDLEIGWRDHERRWDLRPAVFNPFLPGPPPQCRRPFRQPYWDGAAEIVGKRILIWREQGIGDEVMFASCLPDVIALGAQVTVECSAKLLPLFQRSFAPARVLREDGGRDLTRDDFDIHLPMGSLPRFFRPKLESFPNHDGFLKPDPDRVVHWRERLRALGPGPYVGLNWRGRMQICSRGHHYTRIEDWEAVLKIPGIVFVNMQYDDASAELATAQAAFGARVHTFSDIDMWDDLDEVSALLQALDMLITVGTAVMSLAGGLGVPTWLLWVEDLENWPCLGTGGLPWYPRIRLFKRNLDQPWRVVIDRLAEEFRDVAPSLGDPELVGKGLVEKEGQANRGQYRGDLEPPPPPRPAAR